MYSIKDLLRRALQVNADRIAIRDADLTLTWGELIARVRAIADGLRRQGFKPGDRMAIMAANSPRYLELQYAVIWAGGTAVPINIRFAPRELIYCLNDLDQPWIACDEESLRRLAGLRSSLHKPRGLISMESGICPAGYVSYDELLAGDPDAVLPDPGLDDVAIIYFTGGTTGIAKGVMLTHAQMLAGAQQWAASYTHLSEDDVYVHVAPMFHMADGIMCFSVAIVTCCNVFVRKFDLQSFVETCQRYGVTVMTLVPTMARMLCNHLMETAQGISSLRTLVYGAAPMPRAVLQLVMKVFPDIELYHGYGATEALGITMLGPEYHTLDEQGEKRMRSCGRPFRGVLLSIQDSQRRELPPGQVGEVCVRSNSVMKGYWNKPGLTSEVIVDNWYHTGDAGFLDEHGFLVLVDRVKDMLISGGENVYSVEVENVLAQHPAVEECAVVGLPDEKWGETVHAVIRRKNNSHVTEIEIQQFCREYLAGYKIPRSIDFIEQMLPRTSLGKLNKGELKREVIERRH